MLGLLDFNFYNSWLFVLLLPAVAVAIAAILLVARYRRSFREREMQLHAAISNSEQGFCMFGPDGRLQLWNESLLQIYMIPPGQVLSGRSFEELVDVGRAVGSEARELRDLVELRDSIASGEASSLTIELLDGRHVKILQRPMPNGGWMATHEDVTDRKQAEARFAYVALHDLVTGLPNRAALHHRIAENLKTAKDNNARFAVIRLGIDRFKEINDVFGQSAGDAVLAEMARRLGESCEPGFLARPGGDEFSIVTPPDQAASAMEDIFSRLAVICDSEFHIDGQDIRVGSTAGVSVYPDDGEDSETLIAHADIALYRAKAETRGTVRRFESAMDRQIREKRALQRDLAVALKNGEFEIYYQPQATAQGQAVGFETLLRWHHPVRGMVSPGIFIPLAEETGLIGAIDEWVLRTACAEAVAWPNPLAIAVNFSPLDFRHLDVPELIRSVLLETGLAPARLEVEITEGVLIDDFDSAIAILRRIKDLGVRIAMDDFGAGYSSLSYLQAFPFDKIKIDQTFIAKLDSNVDSASIVEAILGLSRALRLPVIAEGVETQSQLAFLTRHGCDEVQGYLIGRPQPVAHYRDVMNDVAAVARVGAVA
ncbi:EAL domain-containing protein [Rhodopseudomonas sp. P2A-2r]|uniref:putative bifunctional diguanylate cyclase/phosphodiesterase n=1 Tax=Rhodopseudomonas sp. P2A-2r TaxID=2991972 RepID=UPI00223409D0|nr:EAL domain-containing protein [Rhodopseudomonas sp. P2A-2r]UZE51224.1 EAL domain-containing protein [Rhodopseudomonas sp. P2A-2r]